MATAGSINIFVNANTRNFDKGIEKVHKSLSGLTKGMADIAASVYLAQQAFGAARGAVDAFVQRIERLDEIADMSERLNISADAIQVFRRAAVIAGGDVESLNKSLAVFQRTLGDAAGGAKGPSGALDKLNLSAKELVNLKLDEAFKLVIARLEAMPTPTERAAVAADLFGKSSGMLAEFLEHGSSALQQASQDIEMFGAKLDGNLDSINKAQNAVERLGLAWEGMWDKFTIGTSQRVMSTWDHLKSQIDTIRGWFTFSGGALPSPFRAGGSNEPIVPPTPPPPHQRFDAAGELPYMLSQWSGLLDSGLASGGMQGAANPGLNFMGGGSIRAFLQQAIGIDALGAPGLRGATGGAAALEFGSAGAFSAIQQSKREDEMRKLQKQEVEETKKINTNLEKILDAGSLLFSLDLQG